MSQIVDFSMLYGPKAPLQFVCLEPQICDLKTIQYQPQQGVILSISIRGHGLRVYPVDGYGRIQSESMDSNKAIVVRNLVMDGYGSSGMFRNA